MLSRGNFPACNLIIEMGQHVSQASLGSSFWHLYQLPLPIGNEVKKKNSKFHVALYKYLDE